MDHDESDPGAIETEQPLGARLGTHLVLNIYRSREDLRAGLIATQINFSTTEVEMPGYLRTIVGSHVAADHCVVGVWVGPVDHEAQTDARRVFNRDGVRAWHLDFRG